MQHLAESEPAARLLARRLRHDLGPRVVAVQLVGRSPGQDRPRARDVDVLLVVTELGDHLRSQVEAIRAEVEAEFEAGIAVKVTSPGAMDQLGEHIWRLLSGGTPMLPEGKGAPPRLALPAAASPPVARADAQRRAHDQVQAALALLAAQLYSDAVSSAFRSMQTMARAWLAPEQQAGRSDPEVLAAFLRQLPGGPDGSLADAVRRARRLQEEADLACREPPTAELAGEVVEDARQLFAALFGQLPESRSL